MHTKDTIIFIFHFNRGKYLENLIHSAERFLPDYPIVIMDDNSSERQTRRILENLSSRYEVKYASLLKSPDAKVGLLHDNMNEAIKYALQKGAKYAIMVQDDQQFVRPIDQEMWASVQHGFSLPNASFVINGCFLKARSDRRKNAPKVLNDMGEGIYHRDLTALKQKKSGLLTAYADTGIYDLDMLKEQMGALKKNELMCEIYLKERGKMMGLMAKPFMHFLPMPVSFRSKRRSLLMRAVDWIAGNGVHPIELIPEDELSKRVVPPHAIEELRAPSLPNLSGWPYRSGTANLIARGGWRAKLGKRLPKSLLR